MRISGDYTPADRGGSRWFKVNEPRAQIRYSTRVNPKFVEIGTRADRVACNRLQDRSKAQLRFVRIAETGT